MIYLYLKTHNKTGLKYLGQTKQDPENYLGSGTRWLSHLKKHGNDIATQILKECKDDKSLTEWGLHYSELWDIVENEMFANLIPERGNQQYFPVKDKNEKQRGSRWINNGKINKKLLKDDDIPGGFAYGRTANVAENMKRSHLKESVKEKMRQRKRPKKKKVQLYQYVCNHCKINFKRRLKAKTKNVFCSRTCRGKARPKISNPEGRNQYSK